MPLRIGLVGWGTMGSALGAQVAAGPLAVELVRIGLRDPLRPHKVPLPLGVEAGSVASLLADDSLDAVVELTGGISLRFGDASRAGDKWAAAARILADPSISALDYIDLRVADRPAVGGAFPAAAAPEVPPPG